MKTIPPHRPDDKNDEWKKRGPSRMTTKQKVGTGVAASIVMILTALGAMGGIQLSIGQRESDDAAAAQVARQRTRDAGQDLSAYVTRQEFQQVRREDRVEYLDNMKEVRSDISYIKTLLMDGARSSRIKAESSSQ